MSEDKKNTAEMKKAVKALKDAGYDCVTIENIQQVKNEWGYNVFVALLGDAMVIYLPDMYSEERIKFVVF